MSPALEAALAANSADALKLLAEFAETTDSAEQWRLFVEVEAILNNLTMAGEFAAADVIRAAYNKLSTFVAIRVKHASAEASRFSVINYYQPGDPRRVRALNIRSREQAVVDQLYPTRRSILANASEALRRPRNEALTAPTVAEAVNLADAVRAA